MTATLLTGDCIELMSVLPAGFVNTCVTSPPYFGLRDYGHDGQIGLEDTPDAYVARLVEVFQAVRRVLRDDGTVWLNLGDSYARSWGNAGGQNRGNGTQREITVGSVVKDQAERNGDFVPPGKYGFADVGIKPKDLIGIPWRVAFALQADGWYLRQDIIWAKNNCMPESVRDRCTKSHEYIFLLSKRPRYYYDHEAIKEPAIWDVDGTGTKSRKARQKTDNKSTPGVKRAGTRPAGFKDASKFGGKHSIGGRKMGDSNDKHHRTKSGNPYKPTGMRNKRDVWRTPTAQFKGAHFAVFPPQLIEPCVLAGSPEGGIVLDPFSGSGTTGQVALQHGRNYIGVELNPEYQQLARKRLKL